MNLKTYNAENCRASRSNRPVIGINVKSGVFSINREAADLMGLKSGDKVEIHQDQDNEGDWYLAKSNGVGFPVRMPKDDAARVLVFNNTRLCRAIADSVVYTGRSGKLLVGTDPVTYEKVKYWPLITANLKNK